MSPNTSVVCGGDGESLKDQWFYFHLSPEGYTRQCWVTVVRMSCSWPSAPRSSSSSRGGKKMEQYLTLVVAVAKIVTWHRPCWISSCSSMKVWDHRWVFEVKMTVKFGVSPSDWSYMSSFLQQSLTLLTCLVMCLPLLVWSLKYVFGVWDVDCWLAYFWQPHYPLSHFTAKSRRKKES